jgi:hypothetical protein
MALTNAKHIIAEIDGIRCTVVESGASEQRIAFLKDLLLANKFEVKVLEEPSEQPGQPVKYTIGVTDLTFNPVFAVYDRSLRTKDGQIVSPDIWNQKDTVYRKMYFRRK